MVKRSLSILVALSMVIAAGCATKSIDTPKPSGGGNGPVDGGTLVIGYSPEPDTLNVYSTHLLGDIEAAVVEGLLIPDDKMDYVPVLAKEVPTAANGGIKVNGTKMDITYHLREGVKWHDGQDFTSEDVKFTWEALKDPKWTAESKEGVEDVESIDTPDKNTVIVHYKEVVANFANTLFTFGIMPKHMLQGKDLNTFDEYNRKPIGTGPFVVKEWKAGQHIQLDKNPNYWQKGKPHLDKIIFKIVPDSNTQVAQLKTGEIGFAQSLPYDKYDELAKESKVKVIKAQLNSWYHIDFNMKLPQLQDLAVRQAFAYATDKDAIAKQLLKGIPVVHDSVIQPMSFAYNPNLTKYAFSVDKAKQVLDQAGWKPGSDGIRAKDGKTLSFTLDVRSGNPVDESLQQVVISQMKQVGIEIKPNSGAAATLSAKWFKGEYELKLHRWILPADPSFTQLYATDRQPPNGNNNVFYSNKELDDLLHKADKTVDRNLRKDLYFKAQEIMNKDLPTIVLFNNVQVVALPANLEGFKANPTNMTHFWNTGDWYLKK